MAIIVENRDHHRLGGSGAKRFSECAYSVPASEKALADGIITKDNGSYAADKGTAVHTIGEKCFETGCDPVDYLGVKIIVGENTFVVDHHMIDSATVYVLFCREEAEALKAEFTAVEYNSELGHLFDGEDIGGPCDYSIVGSNTLCINDYKNGVYPVEIKDNWQFLVYALGMYEALKDNFKIKTIRTTVIQPNYYHQDGPIRTHEYTRRELMKWKNRKLGPAVERVQTVTAMFERDEIPEEGDELGPHPGEHCYFCPLEGLCRANTNQKNEIVKSEFKTLPDPNILTVEEAEEIIERSSSITSWLKKVEQYRKYALESGDTSERFKLVDSLTNRVWTRRAKRKLKKVLGGEIFVEPAMHSPAQMEAVYRKATGGTIKEAKEFIDTYTKRDVKGSSMVPVKDGRAAKVPSIKADFAKALAGNRNPRKSRKSRKSRNG